MTMRRTLLAGRPPHPVFTALSRTNGYRLRRSLAGGLSVRTNLTIFLLFFGIALLDAIRGGAWLRVLFWLAIGTGFFLADRRRPARRGS
jgi:hypothetical protein